MPVKDSEITANLSSWHSRHRGRQHSLAVTLCIIHSVHSILPGHSLICFFLSSDMTKFNHINWNFNFISTIHKLSTVCWNNKTIYVTLYYLYTYLDTWSGFKGAKTAPLPSLGLHHFCKFLSPQMSQLVEDAIASRCGDSLAFWADQEWAPETCPAQIWNFQF